VKNLESAAFVFNGWSGGLDVSLNLL